jgi:multiple sugar transport system ATP-binding protein
MAQIIIQNLHKDFGEFTAVNSSTFTVEDGEFFMLLGPSGCGKTTTLRMIAGLELPTAGEIFIDKKDVSQKPAAERDIAFVFQMFALYPHMNVRKNISYPLKSQGMPKAQINAKVTRVAEILKIEHILNKPVGGLSGGDRQRVALGRAIVREPKAFLMDEPLGALDAEFREHMSRELRTLHNQMGATTVYVTHDQLEAMQMGDKIVVMNHGSVEQFGVPQEIYDWPSTMFVADFIGSPSMNFLRFNGTVKEGDTSVFFGNKSFDIPVQLENTSGNLVFGVRPEHASLKDDSGFRGEVVATEYLGTTQIVSLTTPNGILKARVLATQIARVGETIGLDFNPRTITIFDDSTGKALLSEANKGVLKNG